MRLYSRRAEAGFTLIEMMVATLIALIIIAGLVTNFSRQSNEYSYQNRRIDSVQDMEFAIKFIAEDVRSALVSAAAPTAALSITNDAAGHTTGLSFDVWDDDLDDWGKSTDPVSQKQALALAQNYRAQRHYTYDPATGILSYDRNAINVPQGGDNPSAILPNVTYFRIFSDTPDVTPAGFAQAPAGLPQWTANDPGGTPVQTPGYTILIEIGVPAGYKVGQLQDVKGNTTTDKRVWRYVQVHPMSVVQ